MRGRPRFGLCKNGHDKSLPGAIKLVGRQGKAVCAACYVTYHQMARAVRSERERCRDPKHEHAIRTDGKPYCRTCAKALRGGNGKGRKPSYVSELDADAILRRAIRLETAMPWERAAITKQIQQLQQAQ